ncbi:MAG: hypothetical protein NUV61_04545 [Candidatus Azambacteria bacterium]|nr:hypothetical protein [Candidatus Azambacteria bacterium]
MLTFEKWLDEWKIDSDHEPTEKEIDAMRDAWSGAIQTMNDANICPECGEPFDFCAMGHYEVAKARRQNRT